MTAFESAKVTNIIRASEHTCKRLAHYTLIWSLFEDHGTCEWKGVRLPIWFIVSYAWISYQENLFLWKGIFTQHRGTYLKSVTHWGIPANHSTPLWSIFCSCPKMSLHLYPRLCTTFLRILWRWLKDLLDTLSMRQPTLPEKLYAKSILKKKANYLLLKSCSGAILGLYNVQIIYIHLEIYRIYGKLDKSEW